MINFALPGFWTHQHVVISILELLNEHPEYFYDDVKINAVFGSIPFCPWDGGRILMFNPTPFQYYGSTEKLQMLQAVYKKLNTKIRLIHTNSLITEQDCYDKYCNHILSIFDNDENEIVVNSDLLKEYIKTNYNYNLVSSTTKCLTDYKTALEEVADPNFKYICIDYNLNKNKKFLEAIPEEQKEKVEILVNAICPPGCPTRKLHYTLNSQYGLSYGTRYTLPNCKITNNTIASNSCNNLTPEEIQEYSKNNFINFKLEGRTLSEMENILNFVKYLIKPEYQFKIILELYIQANDYSLERVFNKLN